MINISLLKYVYNIGEIRASRSNCIPQCNRKSNSCIVLTLTKYWTAWPVLFILKKLTQKRKCWAKSQRICQGTREEAKIKDTPWILQTAKFFTPRNRIFGALRCLPFIRINWLRRPLNNGKGFCKVSKPTERNGAYHLQFDVRNFRKITIPIDFKPKISDFLAKSWVLLITSSQSAFRFYGGLNCTRWSAWHKRNTSSNSDWTARKRKWPVR